MQLDRIIAVRNNKTVFCDEDRCYKVFSRDYSKADVFGEAFNHSLAEETGLNVPKLLEVLKIDGKWTLISEYIEGKPLSRLIKERPKKTDEYLNLFVDLQLEIQKKSSPLFKSLKSKMSRSIASSGLSKTVILSLLARLEEIPEGTNLCHGDFSPENVIIAENGNPYTIDWPHAASGNASFDAAKTLLLFRLNGENESAEKYLELFCKKSNIQKQCIENAIPLVAASEISKSNEKERNFFKICIDIAD